MEIERKFLLKSLPDNLEVYPCRHIEQGYLCTDPVVRVRKDNGKYELTCKSRGAMMRREDTFPLDRDSYEHLKGKIDGRLIRKDRYMIPFGDRTIELDIFRDDLAPLTLAEVEFSSKEEAERFAPPEWFSDDVTFRKEYHNSFLSRI